VDAKHQLAPTGSWLPLAIGIAGFFGAILVAVFSR
jgi:hypothetical protein